MKTTKERIAYAILTVAFIAWLVMVCISILQSCSPVKKDQKAVERVLGKDELVAKVGQRINKQPDTVVRTIESTIFDTVTLKEVVFEYVYRDGEEYLVFRDIDTLLPNGIRIRVGENGISATYKAKTKTITVIDRAEAERWRDSTDKLRRETISLYNENHQLREHIKVITPKEKKFPWWVIILGAIIVGAMAIFFRKQTWFIFLVNKLFNIIAKKQEKKAEPVTVQPKARPVPEPAPQKYTTKRKRKNEKII